MPEVSSLPANPDVSQYSPYGRNYGNGLLNLLAFSAFGFNYAPKPEGAQGMYDAYYQRERSRQFMSIQSDAFANNMLFRTAGFDPENNMLQFAGRAFGSPDGMVARMLSPLIGGNPMAAQMQLYAGLSGASVMGAFGRIGDVSKSETDDMMRVIEKNFYRTTPIEQVSDEMNKNFVKELKQNPLLAEQLGIGVPLDGSGEVDQAAQQELKTRGNQREKKAAELLNLEQEFKINEQNIKRPYNPELTTNASNRLQGVLKNIGLSEKDISEIKNNSTGEINIGAAKNNLNKATERLKTPEKYTAQLGDRMAEAMGMPFKKNFISRDIQSEGGIPTKIDGKNVPANLHTREQQDQIKAARQAAAGNNDKVTGVAATSVNSSTQPQSANPAGKGFDYARREAGQRRQKAFEELNAAKDIAKKMGIEDVNKLSYEQNQGVITNINGKAVPKEFITEQESKQTAPKVPQQFNDLLKSLNNDELTSAMDSLSEKLGVPSPTQAIEESKPKLPQKFNDLLKSLNNDELTSAMDSLSEKLGVSSPVRSAGSTQSIQEGKPKLPESFNDLLKSLNNDELTSAMDSLSETLGVSNPIQSNKPTQQANKPTQQVNKPKLPESFNDLLKSLNNDELTSAMDSLSEKLGVSSPVQSNKPTQQANKPKLPESFNDLLKSLNNDELTSAMDSLSEKLGVPNPARVDQSLDSSKPADPSLYDDIVKPETNENARKELDKNIQEGFKLIDAIETNEKDRPFDPDRKQKLSSELDTRLNNLGISQDTLKANKTELDTFTPEFIKSLEENNQTAAQKLTALSKEFKVNEAKIGTPEYNEEKSRELTSSISNVLKDDLNLDAAQLNNAVGKNGLINLDFVQQQAESRKQEVESISSVFGELETLNNRRPASRRELNNISSTVEEQIAQTGTLSKEQIAAGKDENGRVTADLVKTLDSVSETAIQDIKNLTGGLENNELKTTAKQYDKELSKVISDKIKEKLEKAFGATEAELSAATNQQGVVDPQYVRNKLAEQEKKVQGIKQEFNRLEELQKAQEKPGDFSDPEQIEANNQRQVEIRKILKDTYGVTEEQLDKATDEKGNIKAEFIKEVYDKEMERAEVEKTGINFEKLENFKLSEEAPKLRARYFDRQMQSQELGTLQAELKEAQKVDTEEGRARAVQLNKQITDRLKKLGVSEEEIAKNSTPSGGFLGIGDTDYVNEDFVQNKQQDLTKRTYADVEAQRMVQYQQAGFKYSGINFEKTRGFNIEDFTSAFTAASDLRLIGGKGTPVEKMEGFMQNAGGAMSAARSVFGDELSGGQLIGKISDLLGSKAQNLTSQQGSEEVEKMLRDVKATARVAGVSIEALLGVIDAAKEVARNNPRLRMMSSAAITDMTMKAFSTTSAMAGVMNAEEYRRSGGTQQMTAQKIGEDQKLLSSDVGQSVMALQQKFSSNPQQMAAFERVMEEGGFNKTGITERDIPRLLNELAAQPEMEGMSAYDLAFVMNDPTLREFATKNDEIEKRTRKVMQKAAGSQFFRRVESSTGLSREDLINEFTERRKTEENLTLSGFISEKVGGTDPAAMGLFKELQQTISEDFYRAVDPEYFKKIDETREKQAALDAELDKKLGGRNAPLITQIVDELSRGDKLDGTKTEKLMRLFADENVYTDKAEMERLQTGFTQAVEAASTQNMEGAAEGLSKALNVDVSEQDMEDILAGGKVTGDYKEAQNEYRRLLENGPQNEQEEVRLRAYQSMEELGLIDTDSTSTAKQKAFEVFQSGEGAAGVVAGAVEAEKNKKNQEQLQEVKTQVATGLMDELQVRAREGSGLGAEDAAETQKLLDYYKDNGGAEQMMKDAAAGTGAFDKESNVGKTFNQEEGSTVSQVKDRINKANDQINETEKKIQGEGSSSPEEDVAKQLKSLIKALDDSKLTSAIQNLAANISS
jgi:hypothetical protein